MKRGIAAELRSHLANVDGTSRYDKFSAEFFEWLDGATAEWEGVVPIEKLVEAGRRSRLKYLTTDGPLHWFLSGDREIPAPFPVFDNWADFYSFLEANGFTFAEFYIKDEEVEIAIEKAVVEESGVRIFRALRFYTTAILTTRRDPNGEEAWEIKSRLEQTLWGENGNEIFISLPKPVSSFPQANIDLGFVDEKDALFQERIKYLERKAESREREARSLREEVGSLKKLLET